MRSTEEMKKEFQELYTVMATSGNVAYMHVFGNVHKEMMEWFIANKPDLAQDWLDKLEAIRWDNYLSQKEAEKIVGEMVPDAPWSREKWRAAMTQSALPMEHAPYYNSCALYTVMNMLMSDSSETLARYIPAENLFTAVHDLAVDKLTDKDKKFNVREYFGL